MTTTLQIDLDADLVTLAEREAQRRHTTLADLIREQLQQLVRASQQPEAPATPISDSLRDAIKLPSPLNAQEEVTAEIMRRHGLD